MDISSMLSAGSSGRITGMATGIDTDQVIKDMLKGDMLKGDKIYQDKAYLELKQQSYREIIKGVKELQKYFDSTSDKYISASDFNTAKATLSDDKYFSATPSTSAANGTYKVKINKLAEAGKFEGSSVGGVIKVDTTEIQTIKIDGINVVIAKNGDTVLPDALKDKINVKTYDKGTEKYVKFENISGGALNIDNGSGDKEIVDLSNDTKLTQLGIAKGELSFDINGSNLKLTVGIDTTTISDLKSKISEISKGKVAIEIDENLNKINFVSTVTGSESNVNITNMTVENANALGITNGTYILGQDAEVELTMPDGLKTTATSSTNKISEFGLELNLKQADNAQEIEVTVDKEGSVDDIADKIKDFIKDYNTIVGTIHEKLTEKKNYKYKPLTEEEKKGLKEDEIKNWNNKVKSGILRSDPLLEKMLSDLRSAFSNTIYSKYSDTEKDGTKIDSTFGKYGENSIGLDTYADYNKGGQIDLDEIKLEETLKKNPKLIEEFFNKVSEKSLDKDKPYISSEKFKEDGLLNRMNNILKDYVGMPGIGDDGKSTLKGAMNIVINKQYDHSMTGTSSHNTLPDQMYRKQKSLEILQKKIFEKQERLYLQFSKLETAMDKLNAQSSQMMAQFGGM